jgi:hypothetical protein
MDKPIYTDPKRRKFSEVPNDEIIFTTIEQGSFREGFIGGNYTNKIEYTKEDVLHLVPTENKTLIEVQNMLYILHKKS